MTSPASSSAAFEVGQFAGSTTAGPSSSAGAANLSRNTADLAGLSVLVVDDEPDARDVIARVLERAGASATRCASVREAVAALRSARPDVIVSDIAMPNEDGFDLIRIVRDMAGSLSTSSSSGPNMPVPALALTAYAREEDRARCLSCGFGAHLAKPVDPAELLGVVAQLAHAAAPVPPAPAPASAATVA
jgi:CheY-like chemotaxis protein